MPDTKISASNMSPHEDEKVWTLENVFNGSSGSDGEIDWKELQEVLGILVKEVLSLEFPFNGFSADVCRSMLAMLDVDQSGKLSLGEFKTLWDCIIKWKDVFIMYDHSKSGYINICDLQHALDAAGFSITNKILKVLMTKYGDKNGRLDFDDFLMCTVKLTTTMNTMKRWAVKKVLKFADALFRKLLFI